MTFLLLLLPIFGFILFKIYLKYTTGWCKSQVCLINKTVIITGANTGIGYEVALDLAKRGARVILACRNKTKADEACLKIIQETQNPNIFVKLIDLSSFKSVQAFANEINQTEERLDILVNNAGIIGFGSEITEDGHPLIIQINHYSGFLLTNLLLDLLKKSAPSRVINVSSNAAGMAYLFNLDKTDKHISDGVDYFNSKLCNVLFTQELSKRLEGSGVTTFSLHPGVTGTNIFENAGRFKGLVYKYIARLFKTVEEGAQTVIYCCVTQGIEKYSGHHFVDCKKIGPYRTTNPDLARKLWQKTEEIIDLGSNATRNATNSLFVVDQNKKVFK